MLSESNTQKTAANKFFTSAQYSQAIGEYDKALSCCPNYLEYEIAVLKSNIAACHLKLEDWKAAIESATSALDSLERLAPKKGTTSEKDGNEAPNDDHDKNDNDAVVELSSTDPSLAATQLENLTLTDQRKTDITRIRTKTLLRRALAKSTAGGWANLQGAEEDYKTLSQSPNLSSQDRRVVQRALVELPARINVAKESEMGEMMGKLKELGNGILKPFGLSTDNFKMNKDEKTGGYSMNFNQ